MTNQHSAVRRDYVVQVLGVELWSHGRKQEAR